MTDYSWITSARWMPHVFQSGSVSVDAGVYSHLPFLSLHGTAEERFRVAKEIARYLNGEVDRWTTSPQPVSDGVNLSITDVDSGVRIYARNQSIQDPSNRFAWIEDSSPAAFERSVELHQYLLRGALHD